MNRPRPPSKCPKCDAPVLWWQSANSAGMIPVDPSSDDEKGTIRKSVHEHQDPATGIERTVVFGQVLSGDELGAAIASNEMLFTHHSSTCSALRPHNPRPPGLQVEFRSRSGRGYRR